MRYQPRPDGPVVVGEVDQRVAERVGNGFLARVSEARAVSPTRLCFRQRPNRVAATIQTHDSLNG
jgi:hypothetical protein